MLASGSLWWIFSVLGLHSKSGSNLLPVVLATNYEDFSLDSTFGCRVLFQNPDFMDVVRMDRLDGVTRRKSEVLDHEAIALSVGPVDV